MKLHHHYDPYYDDYVYVRRTRRMAPTTARGVKKGRPKSRRMMTLLCSIIDRLHHSDDYAGSITATRGLTERLLDFCNRTLYSAMWCGAEEAS